MKTYIQYILPVILLASCKEQDLDVAPEVPADVVELAGIQAEVAGNLATRAAALDKEYYVGRSAFIHGDEMVLTAIKRTANPINGFTYTDIVYKQEIETGQTSGGWTRLTNRGKYLVNNTTWSTTPPERIYWSDATNGHTYIGYSVPSQQPTGVTFDWEHKNATYGGSGTEGIDVYYGSLGEPTKLQSGTGNDITNYIDYTTGDNIKHDDLLLTYDTKKVAETGGSVAKLYYHHALALVRVVVNIQGFSASTDAADSKSKVSGMILKDMYTMYRWRQQSYCAEELDETYDVNNINAIYNNDSSDGSVKVDQKKDVHLWIPRPDGTGAGTGKQFTFYGLAVPRKMGVNNAETDVDKSKNLHFEFKVKYPNPMNPNVDIEKTYKAFMPNSVEFKAGHCTTINISLNHSNEQMTVGAEYMDWQLVETPDEGELKKGSNFLSTTSRTSVTIASDATATEDDATWLYNAGTADSPVILDIYKNTGDKDSPYTITTAEELLSFAYEVKNGRSFEDQYVKLEANIVMQKSVSPKTSELIDWIGIGDESNSFEGWFDGGVRLITNIKGSSFFHTIGEKAHIEQLIIDSSAGDMTGSGGFAEVNKGIICACKFQGSIKTTLTGTDKYVGGFVGKNEGLIMTSYHLGKITASANIGGVAGQNSGTIVASYSVGKHDNAGYNNGGVTAKLEGQGKCDYCFYNADSVTISSSPDNAIPLITDVMQRSSFVGTNSSQEFDELLGPSSSKTEEEKNTIITANLLRYRDGTLVNNDYHSLNYCIYKWIEANSQILTEKDLRQHFLSRYYVYQPASYPWVY